MKPLIVVDKTLHPRLTYEDRQARARQLQNRARTFRRWLHALDKDIGMVRRAWIWSWSNGRCGYCGIQTNPYQNFTVDHIVPHCEEGTNSYENLMPSCSSCNHTKSGRSLEWLRSHMGVDKFPFEKDGWWLI